MAPPRWFLVVYAMSGAAALVYEVAWTRLLTLSLGHGVAAASTVTAAFMGGLAIGAAVAGPASDRLTRAMAMRLYAGLEIAIALLALALPVGLSLLDPLLSRAYADGTPGVAFPLIRLAASLILVALPAVAMGATFPLVARWYVPSARWATRDAGALYAVNTAGAAAGALATGFALVPWLGLRGTTWVGVALNAAVAASAWWLAQATVDEPALAVPAVEFPAAPGRRRKGGPPVRRDVVPRPWVAAWAMAVSGFLSLALQIVWSRLLAQVLGPTSYAFSLVVAMFILGLAVGAVVGRRLAVGSQQPAAGLTGAIALAVLAAVAAVWTIDFGLMTVAHAVAAPDATFASVLTRQVGLVALWLLPIALALGCVFPFALRTGIGPESALGADLGLIYALNTVGAIAGALAAGFVIIPALGLHASLQWVGAGTAVAGLACLAAARTAGTARLAAAAALLTALGASLGLPRWDQELFASGAYKYAASLTPEALQVALHAGRLVYYAEGATATVSVREGAGTTSLAIDGKVDASNSGDMLTQRLLAHVPLLLHPAPKRVAVLGLGSGVTLGSALTHPIERADVLEISPEVAEASRFFDPENGGALRDSRTRLLLGDGRTHIRLTHEQYDAIISEPSNPWMAGIASLFTREFFAAAKARLAPGGVLCQWAHTYDISADDLKSIVATFAAVFPDGTLWLVGDGDVLLIGSNQPLAPQIAAIPERLAARASARANLATVGVRDAFAITSLLVTDGPGIAAFAGGAPLQTDDHAPVEFTGPRTVFSRGGPDNAAALRALAAEHPVPLVTAAREAASSASWRDRGWMLLDASAAVPAWSDFATAVRMDPRDARALEGLVRAGGATNRAADTAEVLRSAATAPDHVEAQLALSRFLAATGAVADAAQVAFSAAERDPSNLSVLEQLASVVADAGDRERLLPIVSRMRTIAPTADATRYYSASLLFMEGRTELAVGEARALLAANPTHAKGHNLLGAALATLGRRDEARDAFLASIKADPRDPSTYTNLALLELEGGNAAAGLQRLAEALTLDPGSATAREAFDRELARAPGP
ncbi:MAG: fused MFS/spermidine synthase [Vicinamibacterales bacterium]